MERLTALRLCHDTVIYLALTSSRISLSCKQYAFPDGSPGIEKFSILSPHTRMNNLGILDVLTPHLFCRSDQYSCGLRVSRFYNAPSLFDIADVFCSIIIYFSPFLRNHCTFSVSHYIPINPTCVVYL